MTFLGLRMTSSEDFAGTLRSLRTLRPAWYPSRMRTGLGSLLALGLAACGGTPFTAASGDAGDAGHSGDAARPMDGPIVPSLDAQLPPGSDGGCNADLQNDP